MSLKSRMVGVLAGSVATGLLLAGCAASDSPSTEPTDSSSDFSNMDPVVITYSDDNVETAAHAIAMKGFMERVTERTEGKVTFETYFSASLHPRNEVMSALDTGLTHMSYFSSSAIPEQLPIANWQIDVAQSAIPAGFPVSLVTGAPVQFALYESGPMAEELAQWDAMPLVAWTSVPTSLICTPEIETPADLQGLSVRTPGGSSTLDLEAVGLNTLSIPYTEIYEGLQRGIVDCHYGIASTIATLGIWDLAKNLLPANFATTPGMGIAMKKSFFESLPEPVQDIFYDEQARLLTDIVKAALAKNIEVADVADEHGINWVDPTPFNKVIEENREGYVADAIANPPASLDDAQGFVDEFNALVEDWEAVASDVDIPSGTPTDGPGWVELWSSFADIDWDEYETLVAEYIQAHRG